MIWLCGDTDIGQKRASNQDVFLTELFGENAVLMVCDGMGGARGGETASRLALETACTMIKRDVKSNQNENTTRRILECAAAAANSVVYETASLDPNLKGMGTTMVGAAVTGSTAHFVHVGDSRAYLLRDDFLTQLTCDHTVAQMMIASGRKTAEEMANDPDRSKLTRAVGVERMVRPDIFSIDVLPGDAILLCSDGLYNYISHQELCALTAISIKRSSVKPLIERANENGGGDNITAAICLIQEGGEG